MKGLGLSAASRGWGRGGRGDGAGPVVAWSRGLSALLRLLGTARGLTWDLLLHTDALNLFVALGTDTAIAALRVLALLVLSWTHLCLTLVYILREGKAGSGCHCQGPTYSGPDSHLGHIQTLPSALAQTTFHPPFLPLPCPYPPNGFQFMVGKALHAVCAPLAGHSPRHLEPTCW